MLRFFVCLFFLSWARLSEVVILSADDWVCIFFVCFLFRWGFPGGSDGKASPCNAGDLGSFHGSGRSPGKGNGNPLHYSCLENPMDGRAWWSTVHGVAKSQTWLSDFAFILDEASCTGCYWWLGDAGSCIQVVSFVWVLTIWCALGLILW